MSVRTVELLSIDAATVWNLSLKIGLRIGLIVGAILYAFGLPLAAFYGLLVPTELPWLPFILVVFGVPILIALIVLSVAVIQSVSAWLYNQIRKLIGGLQATLDVDGATHRIVRIEPRQALRWLFAQIVLLIVFVIIIMMPFFLFEAQFNPGNIGYELYSFFLNGLAECIAILLTGILMLVLYNSIQKPVSITLGQNDQSTTLMSIGIVGAAAWMTVQAAISQLIVVGIEQSGALGVPQDNLFMSLFILTPFLLLMVFLMQSLSYLIYNWGAQKWSPISFELMSVGAIESSNGALGAQSTLSDPQSVVTVTPKIRTVKKVVSAASKAVKRPKSAKQFR